MTKTKPTHETSVHLKKKNQGVDPKDPAAAPAGPSIAIVGWNSPRFEESHGPWIELLKASVQAQGCRPVFLGISGGSDQSQEDEKASVRSASGNHAHGDPQAGANPQIAMTHYWLPSRDIIADQIEILILEEKLNALILVPWSVNSLVGMLMATARCGIPTLFLPYFPGWPSVRNHAKMAAVKKPDAGILPYSRYSMLLLLEVLGLTRIGALDAFFAAFNAPAAKKAKAAVPKPEADATETGPVKEMSETAQWAGKRIQELAKQNISSRRFFSQAAFHNAACVDMALGGSPESLLHLNAVARELGLSLPLLHFNAIAKKIPVMVPMNRQGEFNLEDLEKLGGLSSLLGTLHSFLQASPTVVGKNIIEIAKDNSGSRSALKLTHPYKKHGSLSVHFGNIAREGALFRISGLKETWLSHTGTARVFDTEEQALSALKAKKIKKGDVLVLRYRGPKGCPGMPHLSALGPALEDAGLEESVAVVTDGRVQLPGHTPAFVQVSPEAATGSALSIIQDGDIIFWDQAAGSISVKLTDTEIKVRLSRWKEQNRDVKNSFLNRYSKHSASTAMGATLT